jgi:hypothetical protein
MQCISKSERHQTKTKTHYTTLPAVFPILSPVKVVLRLHPEADTVCRNDSPVSSFDFTGMGEKRQAAEPDKVPRGTHERTREAFKT